ncbi:MAG: tyrosine--tRNA ligase [Candidatus Levyibacteriota bacterium]
MDKIEELLTRGIANIIPSKKELEKLLRSKKTLNVYLGIDPTMTEIHLGHAVPLRKLQMLADLGANVTFLIGDFTALIGDTSDKDSERPVLTSEQIEKNFKDYKKQAEKILDFSKVKIKFNSEWLKELSFTEIVKFCQHFSVGDFVSRELIKKRLNEGKRVGLHELLYPVMQGYDSYFLDSDIQIGGTDQTFNMQAGRTLQKDLRDKESFIIATQFLMGTDGRKMSKTWGNAIWLDDKPSDMYAKIMAIRDDLIIEYFTLATNIPLSQIENLKEEVKSNPLKAKKKLANEIVKELHGQNETDIAAQNFEKTVQKKETPSEMTIFSLSKTFVSGASISDVLVRTELSLSKSEAKRLIEQRGVSVDNQVISNPNTPFKGEFIKVGKRKFVKIKVED